MLDNCITSTCPYVTFWVKKIDTYQLLDTSLKFDTISFYASSPKKKALKKFTAQH